MREGENVVALPAAETGRESGNHPVANDSRKPQGGPEVGVLQATIGEHVGAAMAQVVPVDFSEVRRKGFKTNATKPGKGQKKGAQKPAQPKAKALKPAPKEVEAHPDEDEIYKYPVLVEFLKGMDQGYEVIANVFCKMRVALRETMVAAGVWQGVENDMPDSRNWFEPISLEKTIERLENPKLDRLVDRASNPQLTEEVQDLAYDRLFGIVAETILMMERRFLRYKFDDEFIKSICDQLIDRFGEKEKGIRQLIVDKLGPDYELLVRKQAEQRWGSLKVVNSDIPPAPSSLDRPSSERPRLAVDEEPDFEK